MKSNKYNNICFWSKSTSTNTNYNYREGISPLLAKKIKYSKPQHQPSDPWLKQDKASQAC